MKRKIGLLLMLVFVFLSSTGAFADDLQFASSREVAAALDEAGLIYAQSGSTASCDALLINYTPSAATQLSKIPVILMIFEGSAAVLSLAITDIDNSDMLALYEALEGINGSVSFVRFLYDAANNRIYSQVDIPYLEDADFGRMVERYAYITALVIDQHYEELAALKK